jgi:gas vesicle protein
MRKRSTNLAMGAVFLAGLGYAAGVLTAPKSGKETRKDIQRAALRAKGEAEAKLKDLNVELGELIEQGKHKAKDVKEGAKGEFVDMLGHAQFARQKAREILSALHEGDAEDKDLKRAINEVNTAIDHLKTYLKKK